MGLISLAPSCECNVFLHIFARATNLSILTLATTIEPSNNFQPKKVAAHTIAKFAAK